MPELEGQLQALAQETERTRRAEAALAAGRTALVNGDLKGARRELEVVALNDPEGKLAEARAKVLERRDLVAERSGGSILVDLNRELQSVVITVAEAEAKLMAAQKALSGFQHARGELHHAPEQPRNRAAVPTAEPVHECAFDRP